MALNQLTAFPHFTSLSPELQRMIWRETIRNTHCLADKDDLDIVLLYHRSLLHTSYELRHMFLNAFIPPWRLKLGVKDRFSLTECGVSAYGFASCSEPSKDGSILLRGVATGMVRWRIRELLIVHKNTEMAPLSRVVVEE